MRCDIRLLLVVVALIAGAATTASSQQPQTSNKSQAQSANGNGQEPATQPRILSEADNGTDVNVAKGSTLVIRLAANPSTGYSWQLGGDPKPLSLDSTKFVSAKSDQRRAGSPEVQVMQFQAKDSGTASLVLEYRRPWEKNVAPAKTFKVQVTVQ
jgi:inhibitor of cysteine peptidase